MSHQALGRCRCGATHSLPEAIRLNSDIGPRMVKVTARVSHTATFLVAVESGDLNPYDLHALVQVAYPDESVEGVEAWEVLEL